jgi:hypothetical protein
MSTLNVDTINDRVGTGQPAISGLAKAWVNFNGTGTVSIRGSYNVSSITDNGTGDYTVNFTTAMPDANYSVVGNARDLAAVYVFGSPLTDAPTTTAIRCRTSDLVVNPVNPVYVSVAIFR